MKTIFASRCLMAALTAWCIMLAADYIDYETLDYNVGGYYENVYEKVKWNQRYTYQQRAQYHSPTTNYYISGSGSVEPGKGDVVQPNRPEWKHASHPYSSYYKVRFHHGTADEVTLTDNVEVGDEEKSGVPEG